ncbi:MAG: pyridoxal phosphate-dependent aminotransferase family protein [Bacteroidia bacterium]
MIFSANQFLSDALRKREEANALRKLTTNNHLIDFCSNDYLGFAQNNELLRLTDYEVSNLKSQISNLTGSTGSRLLAGNSAYAENLEAKIALFHNAEAGLIYNSGYDANVGLFSALGQKDTTIIYDELIHASVHDGIRMSSASAFMFKHNDLIHLEERLNVAKGITYVAVESIYSMDGDTAPLKEIAMLCEKYNANLIVDEAHATGITANNGAGKVQELAIENQMFARVHTFGKALGCHGAVVLGSHLLRNYLINYSRAFIYTTALPLKSLVAIHQAYELLKASESLINTLHSNITHFKNNLSKTVQNKLIASDSAIQCIVVEGNSQIKELAQKIRNDGFDVRPILSPTVAKGKERLRICIHSFNTFEQIESLCNTVNTNIN